MTARGKPPVSPLPAPWPPGADKRLARWLRELLATPGLTSIRDLDEARRVHVDEALGGVELVRTFAGPIVDVGAGGGSPGLPLAAFLPDREVTLLEASERKAAFLAHVADEFPNVSVVRGRAEEQETDRFGVAVARALAPPPVAVEWCLPLVQPGGGVVLWVGPSAPVARVARVAGQLNGELIIDAPPGFMVLRKLGPTPAGFPRRPGRARKRPLS